LTEAAPRSGFDVVMTAPELAAPAVALLDALGCRIHYMPPYPSAAQVGERVAAVQAHAILCRQGRIDGAVMDASARLRIVARHGVGVDEVDVAAAISRGMLVTRAPGSNTAAVAEHTLAMILALLKNFGPLGKTVGAGGWRGTTRVRDAAGLRLGILGFGAIGQAVAGLAAAFGMRVTVYDPAGCVTRVGALRVESLAALLAQSDVLSIHCPLLPQTRHLIDDAALAALPPGALVINTARGGIVDEGALVRALARGHVSGAALDVFENEPPPADHPLRAHPSVIVTPHVAGVTPRALEGMGVMAAECIVAALTGAEIPAERIVCGRG
jgi:D-3-phosphoglycerate dehydrogenase